MVIKSRGSRFVGDNISDYQEGDLVFLGPNLPHYWHKGANAIYGDDPVHAIVIQFSGEIFGKPLMDKIEFSGIKLLFERSMYGIRFFDGTLKMVSDKIKEILKTNGFYKIIYLFEVLNILASAKDYQLLSSPGYKSEQDKEDNDRIDKVYRYILDNYLEKVELEEAASLINMNKSTFCHFFKKRTRKNFIGFVNEVRIGHASKLLIESTKNISEICYECGFKNLSNFNRRFKEINKMSPIDYRRHFNKENIVPQQNFTIVEV
jgi:AraC-like DNA-binding protein